MRVERFGEPVTDAVRRDPPGQRRHEYEDNDCGKKEESKQNADVAHKCQGLKPEVSVEFVGQSATLGIHVFSAAEKRKSREHLHARRLVPELRFQMGNPC